MALNREDILNARPALTAVEVPQWGGPVMIRPLTAADVLRFTEAREGSSGVEQMARLALTSACDEAGQPLFADEDLPALMGKDYAAVELLGREIMTLNKMGAGQDEAARKNS